MMKSAAKLQATSIGVDAQGVMTARIDLPSESYNKAQRLAFYSELVQRVAACPAWNRWTWQCPPVSGGCRQHDHRLRAGPPSRDTRCPRHRCALRFSGLFSRRLASASCEDGYLPIEDRIGRAKVVVVNEAAVRRFWPNIEPIGKSVTLGQGGFHDGAEVVGVVSDVRYSAIEAPAVRTPTSRCCSRRRRGSGCSCAPG